MTKKRRINLKVKQSNGNVLLRLRGDLNGSGACQMEHVLEKLRDVPRTSRLTIDLSGIRDFDYFGVVHFARALRGQRYRFYEISLRGLEATRESLFKRFGLENGKVTRVQL